MAMSGSDDFSPPLRLRSVLKAPRGGFLPSDTAGQSASAAIEPSIARIEGYP
ncbi:hypothetical protein RUM43_009373, partial [Polyplax serrata]